MSLMNSRLAATTVLCFTAILAACSAENKSEHSESRTSSTSSQSLVETKQTENFSYALSSIIDGHTCSTGRHEATSLGNYCWTLKNEVVNRGCASERRQQLFDAQCADAPLTNPHVENALDYNTMDPLAFSSSTFPESMIPASRVKRLSLEPSLGSSWIDEQSSIGTIQSVHDLTATTTMTGFSVYYGISFYPDSDLIESQRANSTASRGRYRATFWAEVIREVKTIPARQPKRNASVPGNAYISKVYIGARFEIGNSYVPSEEVEDYILDGDRYSTTIRRQIPFLAQGYNQMMNRIYAHSINAFHPLNSTSEFMLSDSAESDVQALYNSYLGFTQSPYVAPFCSGSSTTQSPFLIRRFFPNEGETILQQMASFVEAAKTADTGRMSALYFELSPFRN